MARIYNRGLKAVVDGRRCLGSRFESSRTGTCMGSGSAEEEVLRLS